MIADFRSEHVIPPASTQKILTSATALCLLGSDFRFSTFLETDGTIEDGTLKGNLYIRGTGDPTLGSQKVGDQMFLYKWVQALRKKGIRRIEGSVISDASFFDGDAVNPQWIWEDIGNYYFMKAGGINVLNPSDATAQNIYEVDMGYGNDYRYLKGYEQDGEKPLVIVSFQNEKSGMPGVKNRLNTHVKTSRK